MKINLICAVLAASAAAASLEKGRGQWLAENDPEVYEPQQTYPNVIGPPVHVPEQPYHADPVHDVYVEEALAVEPAELSVYYEEPVVYYDEPVFEEPVAAPVAVEEPVVVAEPESEYNYFSLDAVDEEEYSEPETSVTVVPAQTEVVVDDVEKEVAIVDPEPVVYLAPTEEPSDYIEAEEPVEPEVVYEPAPPVLPPPKAPEKPSASPSWLSSWMTELSSAPAPDLPKPTVQKAAVEKYPYGLQSGYTRKWGTNSYTKPVVKEYTTPTFKPIAYTPKKYTPKSVSYTRPESVVEAKKDEERASERKTYSGYDSDDKKYLRTYHNRYSGTPQKSHSHMSCLERLLSRFSKYNTAVRARRQARNASLSQHK